MGFADEVRLQCATSLGAWDWTPAFPVAYTGPKQVTIVPEYNYEVIDNLLGETKGQMTQPIISIGIADSMDTFRSLGGWFTQTIKATRVGVAVCFIAWADQAMGGYETVEKLAGQLQAWAFVNRTSLTSFTNLRMSASKPSYDDNAQIWCYEVTIEGMTLVNYNV